MAMITVKLPDGSPLELSEGATGADAAAAIGPRLAADALGAKVNGELRDLGGELPDGAAISIVTAKSKGEDAEDALWLIRHDAAHVMATAVVELWPGTKVSIGPPIADGFYYDFEFPDGEGPGEDDLERIEAAMREHIAADEPFERADVPAAEAIERFRSEDQPYKVELISDLVAQDGTRPSRCIETARSPTSARARTRRRRAGSRRSSSTRSPARTGAATRAARC